MSSKNDAVSDEPFADLVISILSVNNYSLERVFNIRDGLLQEGISDPDVLPTFGTDEIYKKLLSVGYDRGEFMTSLFAERLHSLGNLVKRQGIGSIRKVLSGTDIRSIGGLLEPVKGVGPVVLRNYACLRDFRSNSK